MKMTTFNRCSLTLRINYSQVIELSLHDKFCSKAYTSLVLFSKFFWFGQNLIDNILKHRSETCMKRKKCNTMNTTWSNTYCFSLTLDLVYNVIMNSETKVKGMNREYRMLLLSLRTIQQRYPVFPRKINTFIQNMRT